MIMDTKRAKTTDSNVRGYRDLIIPNDLKAELPLSEKAKETVENGILTVQNILTREDPRRLAIVGPCSVHDKESIIEYATELKKIADEVKDEVYVVMRTYFEKPRTTVGWKGLINDPYMDKSFESNHGLKLAREILIEINGMGLPCATEFLDTITPQYLDDLVSWTCIGARTTESQTHRQMGSGLTAPVGYKNGTDGTIEIALDALGATDAEHSFFGVNPNTGKVAIVDTLGNKYAHIILRGGKKGPNYESKDVEETQKEMKEKGLNPFVLIDASHANSNKDHKEQPKTAYKIIDQLPTNNGIVGFMLESNIYEGNQKVISGQPLKYGVSITDKCIDLPTTKEILLYAHQTLRSA